MRFNAAAMLPLVAKMGDLLKSGFDQYVALRAAGIEPSPDLISAFLETRMMSWNPRIKGAEVLDDDTRSACARFLGGVAFNIALSQRKEVA